MIEAAAAGPAARYAAPALLRDGSSVLVRAIRPDDKESLRRHFSGLGPESRYFRFFTYKNALSEQELRYFTEPDFRRHVGLVAVRLEHRDEQILGVARYTPSQSAPDDPHRAEFAVAVADAWQGRGLGTALLEHLAKVALANGVREFEGDVLGHNTRMVEMLKATGFALQRTNRGGIFRYTFPTEESEERVQASEQRVWRASAESLRAVMSPRSVAVVGASQRPGTISWALVENLKHPERCKAAKLVMTELEDDAGLFGAALLAREAVK